jgi:hypothetical protein
MKSVPYLAALLLCIVSVVAAQQPERATDPQKTAPTLACEDGADPSQEKTLEPEPAGENPNYGPHTCAIYPISVYGSSMLYQAEHYQDDTCSPPFVTYMYGSFPYPEQCGVDCEPWACPKRPKPWYGLTMPVPANWVHAMPGGKPDTYARRISTPNGTKYLWLTGIDGRDVYVKLFSYKFNRIDLKPPAKPPQNGNFLETFHFAFECQSPEDIGLSTAGIPEITSDKCAGLQDPVSKMTTAYDVTYSFAGGREQILTFLCGFPKEEDLVPEPEPCPQTTPSTPSTTPSTPAPPTTPTTSPTTPTKPVAADSAPSETR